MTMGRPSASTKTKVCEAVLISALTLVGPGCVSTSRPNEVSVRPNVELAARSHRQQAEASGDALPGLPWYFATFSGVLPASEAVGFLLDVLALPVTYPAYWATGGDEVWAMPVSRSILNAWIGLLDPENSENSP